MYHSITKEKCIFGYYFHADNFFFIQLLFPRAIFSFDIFSLIHFTCMTSVYNFSTIFTNNITPKLYNGSNNHDSTIASLLSNGIALFSYYLARERKMTHCGPPSNWKGKGRSVLPLSVGASVFGRSDTWSNVVTRIGWTVYPLPPIPYGRSREPHYITLFPRRPAYTCIRAWHTAVHKRKKMYPPGESECIIKIIILFLYTFFSSVRCNVCIILIRIIIIVVKVWMWANSYT